MDNKKILELRALHWGAILSYAKYLNPNLLTAEELAEETFTDFIMAAIEREITYPRSYMRSISFHRVIELEEQSPPSTYLTDNLPVSDKHDDTYEVVQDIFNRARLTRMEANVILLKHIFGFSHDQIKDMLHTTINTVYVSLSKGKKKIVQLYLDDNKKSGGIPPRA